MRCGLGRVGGLAGQEGTVRLRQDRRPLEHAFVFGFPVTRALAAFQPGPALGALALRKDRAVVADGATDGATVADPRALAPDASANGQSREKSRELLGCACKCSPRRRSVVFFR